MCLVCSWKIGLSAIWHADSLSHKRGVGSFICTSKFANSHQIQRISLTVVAIARYSTFVDDRETTDCFFDFQDIGVPPKINKYIVHDIRKKGHPNQSESLYAINFVPPSFGNSIHWPKVVLGYLSTLIAASRWLCLGSNTNWLNTLTA